jgi:hypothetical protein
MEGPNINPVAWQSHLANPSARGAEKVINKRDKLHKNLSKKLKTTEVAANASGFDYILAPPSRVLVSRHRPSASGLIP